MDILVYWSHGIIRIKARVRDPKEIPRTAIEEIVEGGPLLDGMLISNRDNVSKGGNMTPKRPKGGGSDNASVSNGTCTMNVDGVIFGQFS